MLKSYVGNSDAVFDVDKIDQRAWDRLAKKMSYVPGDFTKPELYENIRDALDAAEKAHGTQGNVIFYLAVADRFFGSVVDRLGKAKLTDQGKDKDGKHQFWRRVVVEKPFGHSLDSARELNASIRRTLHENQIFRIDHFLGKERFKALWRSVSPMGCLSQSGIATGSIMCRSPWRRRWAWSSAANFTRRRGAARYGPNHVFTLLSILAMEPPTGFDAAAICTKRAEVFAAMPAIKPARAVRGQYGVGTVVGSG